MTPEIYLRRLRLSDVTHYYVEWLNDSSTNQYLESRFHVHTIDSVSDYVKQMEQPSSESVLLGIFHAETSLHIGNVKIGPINSHHLYADLGLIVARDYWGRGIGTRSISLASIYASSVLELRVLRAGVYSNNLGSYRAFLKAGWTSSGAIPGQWLGNDGLPQDELLLHTTLQAHHLNLAKERILLIGSGVLMFEYAKFLALQAATVTVVTSPRQHDTALFEIYRDYIAHYYMVDDINVSSRIPDTVYNAALCVCFGPAWIFDTQCLKRLPAQIFNYNGIPLPRYLGGGHYSWQILNGSSDGAATIQRITSDLDRGPVVCYGSYVIPSGLSRPLDYDRFNLLSGLRMLREFTYSIFTGVTLEPIDIDWMSKEYYPRLNTPIQSWINWSWDAECIYRFCLSFSDPYPGARTLFGASTVILRPLSLEVRPMQHPFTAGLIINRSKERAVFTVSCFKGLIDFELLSSSDIRVEELNVGDRLFTPDAKLQQSLMRVSYTPKGTAGP